MTDERLKQLMEQVGMPNSISLYGALQQAENEGFQAGAASRDAYIERLETGLLQVRNALCGDIHNTDDLLDLIASLDAEIAELVAALKQFGAIDLVESRLPAEFAMLILRARAAIAKASKP